MNRLEGDLVVVRAQVARNLKWRSWVRNLRNPIRPLFKMAGRPWNDLQAEFVRHRGWPRKTRERLALLPAEFLSNYSLIADEALPLFQQALEKPLAARLEIGCGISTVVQALALEEQAASATAAPLFVSLDTEREWLDRTSDALKRLGLLKWVNLLHAPLEPFECSGSSMQAPSLKPLEAFFKEKAAVERFSFIFIDVPPSHIGRQGVLPHFAGQLAPGAEIWLHDALRDSEQQAVKQWTAAGLACMKGYLAVGRVTAVLEAGV